jgi:hypothetical protein
MKIEIDKNGNLWIERAGKMKTQYCPSVMFDGEFVGCGDWCPKFREPHYCQGDMRIELCGGNIWCVNPADFLDERNNEG